MSTSTKVVNTWLTQSKQGPIFTDWIVFLTFRFLTPRGFQGIEWSLLPCNWKHRPCRTASSEDNGRPLKRIKLEQSEIGTESDVVNLPNPHCGLSCQTQTILFAINMKANESKLNAVQVFLIGRDHGRCKPKKTLYPYHLTSSKHEQRHKMEINNTAELVCAEDGAPLYLVTKSKNQFLMHRELSLILFKARQWKLELPYPPYLHSLSCPPITPGLRFSFGSGEWRSDRDPWLSVLKRTMFGTIMCEFIRGEYSCCYHLFIM